MGDFLKKAYADAEKQALWKTRWITAVKYIKTIHRFQADIHTETLTDSDLTTFYYEFAQQPSLEELALEIEKRRAEMNARYDYLLEQIKNYKIGGTDE